MTASWKIFAFASVALAGAFGAACTVTTNSGDDDSGIFDYDSGTTDTGTTDQDTGTTTPACANEVYPDGGTTALSLDAPGSGSTACTTCTVSSCCTQLSACFQDPTGDCQDLESCLEACDEASADAGDCANDCASLHPDSVDLHNAWGDCQQSNCATSCQ